jgi:elongation factor P
VKIGGNTIRPGNVLEHKGKLWTVTKTQHVKPGKGGAFMQVEMKDVRSGTKLNERFRSSEVVERVRLDQKDFQFLFSDGDQHTFMDQDSYEQITVSGDLIGDPVVFLTDGMKVIMEMHEGEPLGVQLPESVICTITETEAVVKGQTAASSYKPATLDNGVRIMVPPFIESGEKVVVNTAEAAYVERAK